MVSKKSDSENIETDKHIPELNIGILGHVDHGKTTLTQALTGKFTDEHSEELKRGISIRLGYADMEIRKCPKCEGAKAYTTMPKCMEHEIDTEYVLALSVIDCPGHETLMATVLTGASLMDGALLVIAANEECPQPQTAEHLIVLNIAGIKNIVIVQNKVDLVDEAQMQKNYNQIKAFVKGSVAENAPIIPVSALHKAIIDILLFAIAELIKPKPHDSKADPIMFIARSFDVNRPGTDIPCLTGAVVGGSLIRGEIKSGDKIEIRPGAKKENKWIPLKSSVAGINQGNVSLSVGKPGGLLSIGTFLDPVLAKSDNLVGNVLGLEGKLPPVFNSVKLEMHTFERLVDAKQIKNDVRQNDALLMNVNTSRTIGTCTKPGKVSEFVLKIPVCASVGDKVALSRQIESKWRLIGWGIIRG